MAYWPVAVANTFLSKFGQQQGGIDHMKLQKLTYCTHGWWLAYYAEPLLTEAPQVWKFGPVFPSLYNEMKVYGMSPIPYPVKPSPFLPVAPIVPATDANANQLIDWVWGRYGHLSGMALSDMTHKEGTAWRKVAEARQFKVPMGLALSAEDVREEFNKLKEQFNNGQ